MKTTVWFGRLMSVALAVAVVLAGAACAPAAPNPTPTPEKAAKIPASELVQPGKLTIATTGSALPFTSVNKDGKLEGYDIDVCNALAAKLGLTTQWTTIEWAGTLPGLKAGRWDMVCSGVGLTTARLTSPDFTMSIGTVQGGGAFYVRADDNRFSKQEDLNGKTMGGVRGAWYSGYVKDTLKIDAKLVEYPSTNELFLDLGNGRIDFAVSNALEGGAIAQQYKAKQILSVYNPTPYGVAIRKEAPTLVKETNLAFWEFQQNGQLEQWQTKWFGKPYLIGSQ
jgi:ABC-type amino acid transport substrate-binding protein